MRRGLSLLEVVVALAILGVVVPLMLNLFPSSLRALRRCEVLQTATALATYRMDEAALVERRPGLDVDEVVTVGPRRYRVTRTFHEVDIYRLDAEVVVRCLDDSSGPVRVQTRFRGEGE